MTINQSQPFFSKRRKKWAGWVLGLFAFYLIVGFFVVPRVVDSVLRSQVAEALNATVEVERVSFNPLTLRLQLEGLILKDGSGEKVMSLQQGRFALSLRSVYQFAGVLREVDLLAPELFITRMEDGELNILSLLPEVAGDAPKAVDEELSLPRLGISVLKIREGRMEFADKSLNQPFSFGFHPIDFELNDFTTFRDEGNRLSFSAEDFYGGSLSGSGSFSPQDFTAALELSLQDLELPAFAPYVTEFVDIDLRSGRLSFKFQVTADARSEGELLRGAVEGLEVQSVEVFTPGASEALLQLEQITLGKLQFGAFEPWVELDSLLIRDGHARLVLLEDRSPEILSLIADLPDTGGGEPSAAADLELPLRFNVASVKIENFGLTIEDRSLGNHPQLQASIENLELRDLSEQLDRSIPFDLSGTLLEEGKIAATGGIAPMPLIADLEFETTNLQLPTLNPWLGEFTPATIASGTSFAQGRIQAKLEPGKDLPEIRISAEAGLDSFALQHAGERLAGLDSIRINGIGFLLDPMSVEVESIDLQAPTANIVRDREGRINLLALLREPLEVDEQTEDLETVALPAGGDFDFSWKLGRIDIRHGDIAFSDDSVRPGFSTRIENMRLQLAELDSDPTSRANLSFSGRFADAGTIEVAGTTNANPADLFADLKVSMRGFGLPPTSGYSGQFVGRAIDRGRLDLSIEAQVADESLSASNAVLVRNLALGARTDHPDAMRLPLDLAVSLLSNRQGEISLNIPLSGRMDDPQFSIASVASQAFSTVIGNIVSSPFSILGNLVGSRAEELSQVSFRAGSAELPDSERETIADLIEALYQRPALGLEIIAHANRSEDGAEIAREKLMDRLREFLLAENADSGDIADSELWADESLILSYYEHRFGPIAGVSESNEEVPQDSAPRERSRQSGESSTAQADDSPERGLLGRFVDWFTGRDRESGEPVDPVAGEATESVEEADDSLETLPEVQAPDLRTMRDRLLAEIEVSDEQLLRLGRDRADTLRAVFVDSDRIEADRIHIGTVQIGSEAKAEFDVR